MIYHFVKRDFKSHFINWAILLIIVTACLWAMRLASEVIFVLGACLMFYAILPLQTITGASWRSQHSMSRNYLLSLPVPRKKMFFIVQIRAFVFALPIFLYALLIPEASDFFSALVPQAQQNRFFYVLNVFLLLVWMINSSISANLVFEKISTYQTKLQRSLCWTLSLSVFFAELAFLIWSLATPHEGYLKQIFLTLMVLLLSANRLRQTQNNWIGT